jgi:hypothetical protein
MNKENRTNNSEQMFRKIKYGVKTITDRISFISPFSPHSFALSSNSSTTSGVDDKIF